MSKKELKQRIQELEDALRDLTQDGVDKHTPMIEGDNPEDVVKFYTKRKYLLRARELLSVSD